jgi:DNA primase large subunit
MELALQYPFMTKARELVAGLDIDPIASFKADHSIRDRVDAMIDLCLTGRRSDALSAGNGLLVAHAWLRLVLAFVADPSFIYKIATNLSKEYERLLVREPIAAIKAIACDQGLHAEAPDEGRWFNEFDYRVFFTEYLNVATRFKSPAWHLVNMPLGGGFVYLTKHDLCRMLVEVVNTHVISSLDLANRPETKELKRVFVAEFKEYLDKLVAKAVARSRGKPSMLDDSNIALDPACFPPCIKNILSRIHDGINLTHSERLFVVSFCSFTGMDASSIAGIFRGQPDFNEALTIKQVASIIGTDTGRKAKYKPSNCVKLFSIGICTSEFHDGCCKTKPVVNPMIAYKRKLYARSKQQPSPKK